VAKPRSRDVAWGGEIHRFYCSKCDRVIETVGVAVTCSRGHDRIVCKEVGKHDRPTQNTDDLSETEV
jgi:RNase P subunit RPR2